LANNKIDKLILRVNAYMTSEDTLKNFNQIKGRLMVIHFVENKLQKVDVDGNGESLYFAIDEVEVALVGMNKILCSSMLIMFKANKADKITFYSQPEAQFIPPQELTGDATKLKGFAWRQEERPQLANVTIEPGINDSKAGKGRKKRRQGRKNKGGKPKPAQLSSQGDK